MDRHVYTNNLSGQKNSPTGDGSDATDQPGLKDMTLKAIEILHAQAKKKNTGFFLMYVLVELNKGIILIMIIGLRLLASIRYVYT